ncbi:hypothetical protein [Labrenzia sp. PHM005]|uniref:hypothetical protein n=1 Tax=Labrenzia sp. PHM005 TaxID=2590016 RepID=UPI00113FD79A|nr:hypothetical protein [Labrenzia sp. PHM005]QDG75573.1 hypothetical protein FJ695_06665 [Labrenzia sp. PHM005]
MLVSLVFDPLVADAPVVLLEELEAEDELAGSADLPAVAVLSLTFSGFKSIVTGRLEPEEDDPDDGLPGFEDAPESLPSDDVGPPGDFLSVAIFIPPEPGRPQDLHYTRLFVKRYRCGNVSCAAIQRLPRFWLTIS